VHSTINFTIPITYYDTKINFLTTNFEVSNGDVLNS